MKNILLFLFGLFYGVQSFAQDSNPDLFRTWYVTEVQSNFITWDVIDITPRISPTLVLTETFNFSGEAACNIYTGTLSYDSTTNYFEILSFVRTNNTCNEQTHTNFEAEFFNFFIVGHSFSPWVDNESNGEQSLYTISPWYPLINGKNTALGVNEYSASRVTVYPNPVTDRLFITTENAQMIKIEVYSISGKKVFENLKFENSVDVSSLSKGIYFLEIISEEGRDIRKFIKG
jgi:hypothetical protein